MRKLDNEEVVKDSIQDLFVKLWLRRGNISVTDNIKYYLLASLKHLLINAGMQKARTPVESIDEPGIFTLHFTTQDGGERAHQPDRRLLDALNQLTGRQKEVLYLRYFEEMSYEQIAELMDISVKGIYKLNYRALDALKELMQLPKKDILLLLAACRIWLFS